MRLSIPTLVVAMFLIAVSSSFVAQAEVDESGLNFESSLNRFGRRVRDQQPSTKKPKFGLAVAERIKRIVEKNSSLASPSVTDDSASEPQPEVEQPVNGNICSYCSRPYLDPEEAKANFAAASQDPEVAKHTCRYCGNILS